MKMKTLTLAAGVVALVRVATAWEMGEPITTYWAGPGYRGHPEHMTARAAQELKDGGYSVVWASNVSDLDMCAKYGLRAIYGFGLGGVNLDDEKSRAWLTTSINAVKNHPALYLYHLDDEPPAENFAKLARIRDFVRSVDPKHPCWVNLLPTYANNRQLGVQGPIFRAYWDHVRLFGEVFRPELISYDHYQFNNGGDTADYFANLEIIRQSAALQGVPFVNGVQACTWRPGSAASPADPRIPNSDEMRYLVYTTLAYGAQGIYYYVYSFRGHAGAIAETNGTTNAKYDALKTLNREFIAIAKEMRGGHFVGAYVQGMQAYGTTPYRADAILRLSPETPNVPFEKNSRLVNSSLVTRFDRPDGGKHLMLVNLDYRTERTLKVSAPSPLEQFDPKTGIWTAFTAGAEVNLLRGGGILFRTAR